MAAASAFALAVLILAYVTLFQQKETVAATPFDRALLYYAEGQTARALGEINLAITKHPDSAAYRTRGNIYLELKEYAKAADDYSKAIFLKPTDATAFGYRGWCFRHLGQYDKAIADWQASDRLLNSNSKTELKKGKHSVQAQKKSVRQNRGHNSKSEVL